MGDEEELKNLDEKTLKLKEKVDYHFGKGQMWGMCDYANIDNIAEWLSYAGHFDFLSEGELEVLKEFGIEQVKTEKGVEYIDVNKKKGE